jgi:hypothetical protein
MRTATLLLAMLLGACTRAPAPQAAPPPPVGPDAGTVVVEVKPYGSDVAADGTVRCRAPCSFRIDPGLHRLTVHRSGFLPWQEDVRVAPGAEVRVSATLVSSH